MKFFIPVVMVLSLLCTSCAAPMLPEQLSEIEPVKSPKALYIRNPIRVTAESSAQTLNGSGAVYGLAGGLYVALEENAHGTFYKGPGRAVVFGSGPLNFIQPGGLWVPKGSDIRKLKIYVYMSPENQRRYPDLPSAYAAQHEPVSNAQGRTDIPPAVNDGAANQVIVDTVTRLNLSPAQAGIAGGIAAALIYGIAAAEATKNHGKPSFLSAAPELDYDTIKEQIEFRE